MSTTEEVLQILKDISYQSIGAKPETTIPIDLKRIRKLRETEAKAILSNQGIVVGGSVAARSQVRGHRLAEDLDIYATNPQASIVRIVAKLSQMYGVGNVKTVYVPSKKVTRISVRKKGKWVTVVDVKQLERPGTLLETVGTPIHSAINVGGIQIQPVGELIGRKAQGIVNSCFEPRSKRCSKDLKDFETYVRSVMRSAGKEKARRLQSSLIKFKKSIKKRHVKKEKSPFGFDADRIFDW